MKQRLLQVGTALYFALGMGVLGALAGFGWSLVYPAQYTSSAHITVPTGQFAGDYPAADAYVKRLVTAALDPQALSIVIVSRDLYDGGERHRPLGPLVDRLRSHLQIHSHTNLQNAAIDLSLTYPDRLKVQAALDKVIWLLRDAERQQNRVASTHWTFTALLTTNRATEAVRTRGLDQGTLLALGFAAGLLLNLAMAPLAKAAA